MPIMHTMTQPADIAAALASTVDMLDRLRVFVRDPATVAEIDRRIAGSARLLLGAPYLDRRHCTENVEHIMHEVEAAMARPVRRAAR